MIGQMKSSGFLTADKRIVRVAFPHGLGDCTMFAHQIPLYLRRGLEVQVACNPDKRILFAGTGARIIPMSADFPQFRWEHPPLETPTAEKSLACWNKAAWNFSTGPMPYIGKPEHLWDEYCRERIDIRPHISEPAWQRVSRFLDPLPRPIVLLHTVGNSFQETKSLSRELTMRLYDELLDRMEGTLILLDWDNRVPKLDHFRVRHLTDDLERIDVEHLLALLDHSDLMIGIDSGPLHAARYTNTPTLGIFWHAGHHPTRYCLPRRRQACIVPDGVLPLLTERARLDYHILSAPGDRIDAVFIARHAVRMLDGSRYLGPEQSGADIQLQQMVRDWLRGCGNEVSGRMDRDRGWDAVLRESAKRFDRPVIVETGCIRSPRDWRGAGNSTVILAEYAHHQNGTFVSVDLDEQHCRLARQMTAVIPCASVVCGDSVALLKSFRGKLDLLYLDSMDTFLPGSAEHALQELSAALPHLHEQSVVVFDDTCYSAKGFRGKGALAVPFMLANGWRLLCSGYQTALVRRR